MVTRTHVRRHASAHKRTWSCTPATIYTQIPTPLSAFLRLSLLFFCGCVSLKSITCIARKCVYMCMRALVCARVRACVRACVRVCVCVCVCLCLCLCLCVCVCIIYVHRDGRGGVVLLNTCACVCRRGTGRRRLPSAYVSH